MSSSREYRQLLVRMGKASLARDVRDPPKPEFPVKLIDTVIFGSLAAVAVGALLVALLSGFDWNFAVSW